jgi:prepilin-type N-terminal cleavage/methylation domain-containing protein
MKNFVKKLTGFTLAEVLITLLIIGVVASLVIPAIIQDAQQAEFKAAWKKAYADIDQTVKMNMIDNGGDLVSAFQNTNDYTDKILAHLAFTKKCYFGYSTGNCWHSGQSLHQLNGNPEDFWANDNDPGAVLSNGNLLYFYFRSIECTDRSGGNINFDICGQIMVDVNGFKGPNTIGKDVFGIWVKKNGIMPYGTIEDNWIDATTISTCNPIKTGWGCSAKYLYQ